jgi:type VI protein secretion system component Hcp
VEYPPPIATGGRTAVPIYMKFGKIKGEVKTPPPYVDWIELESAQFGPTRHPPGGRRGSEREPPATIQEIVASKLQDSVSPLLFQASMKGEGVEVIIDFVKNDPPERYMQITLKNV